MRSKWEKDRSEGRFDELASGIHGSIMACAAAPGLTQVKGIIW